MHPLNQQFKPRLLRTLTGLSAGALALALSVPVQAQYGSGSGTGSTGAGSTNPASPDSPAAGTASGPSASLNEEDRNMIEDLAEANIAEIETGQLALSKSQNPQVRDYAQKMIDEHQSAQQELRLLAQSKRMTLPQETDLAHKTVSGALRLLSGETFESQYINRVGVDDHERTIELLQKAQSQARDPELKAMAGRMLPVVQGHLDMAKQISERREQREQQQDRQQQGSGATGGTGGSSLGTGSGTGSGSGAGGTGGTR